MTSTITTRQAGSAAEYQPQVRRFTAKEYHRMMDAGVLRPDERTELLDGQIIKMAPVGDPHVILVNLLTRLLVVALGLRAIVSVQNPIRLSPRSEPQPDVVLLRAEPGDPDAGRPLLKHVLLLIEVSDTTFRYDRYTKLPRYAERGVPEVWIFDLKAKQLHVFRVPEGESYRDEQVLTEGSVSPLAFPNVTLDVAELLR